MPLLKGGRKRAVIEVDELAARKVFPMLRPRVIVLTNLFRDQLDRYAEVESAASYLREGIEAVPGAVLCLNADDSLIAGLADGLPNKKIFYGFSEKASHNVRPDPGEEGTRCPRCGEALLFACSSYGHLGHWSCPSCGLSRPCADICVESISCGESGSDAEVSVFGEHYSAHVCAPADYNVYNAAAAVSGAAAAGCDAKAVLRSLGSFERGFGRMERFDVGAGALMILIKNPAGCDRALDYILGSRGDFGLIVCLNDLDADGCDVSWIWDAGFERLREAGERLKWVIASGRRADELATRLEYAGIPESRLKKEKSAHRLIAEAEAAEVPVYILPTYTAMMDMRRRLAKKTRRRGFWEG